MIPAVIARVLLVVFALGVCVWAGVLARDAHLQEQGTELGIKGLKDAAVLPTALGDLHDAALLNLDTTPKVLRARVLAATGHPREATALATEVVQAEPDNITAWVVLAQAPRRTDPALARLAAARVRALNPRQ